MKSIFARCLLYICMIMFVGCSAYHRTDRQELLLSSFDQLKPRYCLIDQGQLEYYQFGHGTPIVLIAGYVSDVTSWNRHFLAALAQHHQVIVFNNRNVGKSVVRNNHYSSHDLANDTHQLIQKLKLRKPAVLGISMGGMIAQQLVVDYPEQIGQLILINTAMSGRYSVKPGENTENEMLDIPKNKYLLYIFAVNHFFPVEWRARMSVDILFNRFQPEQFSDDNLATIISLQRTLLTEWVENDSTATRLSQIHIPVLILNGLADSVIPPKNSELLANKIPRAQLKRWREGGHGIIFQYPEAMAKEVNLFLR